MLNTIEEALSDLRLGKTIIVVDDEDRENEGDFVAAGSTITPDLVNMMITKGKGLMCVSMSSSKAQSLELPPMVINNTDPKQTAFTVSIDYTLKGCTTGISCYDRATTINELASKVVSPNDFCRPGHIFPLIAKEGGVLTRNGHTEASLDLTMLAGLGDVGVLIEIIKDDGTMARLPDLLVMAKELDLKIISIEDLIKYRLATGL